MYLSFHFVILYYIVTRFFLIKSYHSYIYFTSKKYVDAIEHDRKYTRQCGL